ncbi:MAG TPA: hypothetical protein VKT32_02950, partial [Chthonomonadaceae bacterium]|nr:hypothetical protein [Chthonomonadaceae bacterium]
MADNLTGEPTANVGQATASQAFLLVPITVEAAPISTLDSQSESWSQEGMSFSNLAKYQDPAPNPFNSQGVIPPGITVQWALPDALTHGIASGDSPVTFPPIPNRWVVLRMFGASGEQGNTQQYSWIVQSDVQNGSTDANNLGASYIDPNNLTNYFNIGAATPLAEWTGETTPSAATLTAVGFSDAAFAAFYPSSRTVLSFTDPVSDGATGPFTYLVVGWYSDAANDPLNPANPNLALYLGENGYWTLENPEDPAPTLSLYHGMVYHVPWQGVNGGPYIPPPDLTAMATVGNTSAEALGTLVDYQVRGQKAGPAPYPIEEILTLMQYGELSALDTPAPTHSAQRELHAARFSSQPGGSCWVAVTPPQTANPPAPIVLPPNWQTLLNAALGNLNALQTQLDTANRSLASAQQQLYITAWKSAYITANNLQSDSYYQPVVPYPDLIAYWEAQIQAQNASITALTQAITEAQTAMEPLLGNTLVLQQRALPPFWRPNDPVVLFSGLGRSNTYGEDGRFNAQNQLVCRISGEEIAGFAVPLPPPGPSAPEAVYATNLALPALPALALIPADIPALYAEAFFLDTNNAAWIGHLALQLAGETDTTPTPQLIQAIQALQTAPFQNAEEGAARALLAAGLLPGYLGPSGAAVLLPSPVAVTPWQFPWNPLYVAWEATFTPSYSAPDAALQNWTLQGFDYVLTAQPTDTLPSVTLTGRTLLTPQATQAFREQFETFLNQNLAAIVGEEPTGEGYEADQVSAVIQAIAAWDILSQTLSGFTDFLVQRTGTFHAPLDPAIMALLGADTYEIPYLTGFPPSYPIRAGIFSLNQLAVVDSFGRSIALDTQQYLEPVPAEGLIQVANAGWLQNGQYALPPRLCQFGRLRFLLRSAMDDTVDTEL